MKHVVLFLIFTFLQVHSIVAYSPKYQHIQLPNSSNDTYCFVIPENENVLYYTSDNKVNCYDIITNKVVKILEIQVGSPVTAIQVQSELDNIYLGTKAGKLIVISKSTGELIFEKDYKAGSINVLEFTNNKNNLLCGCENGMIYQQSAIRAEDMSEFYQHDKAITSIAVSDSLHLIAISRADGIVSLFKDNSYEWLSKINSGEDWIRKVTFNDSKNRLLCVGDDGRLYEWNIANIEKPRLLNQDKVSRNWLLSLDIGNEGKVKCWGGLDHHLKITTQFARIETKLKGPILKVQLIQDVLPGTVVVCCILGKGVQIIPIKAMKFKSIYSN